MIIEYLLQLPAEWLKKEIERVSITHSENKVSKIYNVWLNTLIFTALNFPNIVIMLPLLIFATYGFRCIICFLREGDQAQLSNYCLLHIYNFCIITC